MVEVMVVLLHCRLTLTVRPMSARVSPSRCHLQANVLIRQRLDASSGLVSGNEMSRSFGRARLYPIKTQRITSLRKRVVVQVPQRYRNAWLE